MLDSENVKTYWESYDIGPIAYIGNLLYKNSILYYISW